MTMRMLVRILSVTLTCFLMPGCSFEDETAARIAANLHAIKEARKIQAEIETRRRCPDDLDGWSRNTDIAALAPLETFAGTEEIKYRMYFNCRDDLDFSITIKLDIDEWTYVVGNAAGPLEIRYGHFTDLRGIKIPSGADIHAIAVKAARG